MYMRKLPIGIQDFEYIRKNNFVYADKTDYISSLARNGKVYFLSHIPFLNSILQARIILLPMRFKKR